MSRPTCQRCGERPATSAATCLCEVCLYAEVAGKEKAAEQAALAEAERLKGKRNRHKEGR